MCATNPIFAVSSRRVKDQRELIIINLWNCAIKIINKMSARAGRRAFNIPLSHLNVEASNIFLIQFSSHCISLLCVCVFFFVVKCKSTVAIFHIKIKSIWKLWSYWIMIAPVLTWNIYGIWKFFVTYVTSA